MRPRDQDGREYKFVITGFDIANAHEEYAMTTPTPPDADAREVIATRLLRFHGSLTDAPLSKDYELADQIIAALSAAGYSITRPERGMVEISVEAAAVAQEAITRVLSNEDADYDWHTWLPARSEFDAIAAADPQEPGNVDWCLACVERPKLFPSNFCAECEADMKKRDEDLRNRTISTRIESE
jgi:hypothetical protein